MATTSTTTGTTTSVGSKNIIFDDSDVPFEEEILRHPFSIKCWIRYIEHKTLTSGSSLAVNVYERALKELPGRCESLNMTTRPREWV
jgi:hypothetical protein